jgi:hypothetical protein
MLGPPMVYITHISSKSSIFETLGVNESTDTYPILTSICICFERKYSRIPNIRIFVANTRDYSHIFALKTEYKYKYGVARMREYSYLRMYARYTPWRKAVAQARHPNNLAHTRELHEYQVYWILMNNSRICSIKYLFCNTRICCEYQFPETTYAQVFF